MSWRELLTIHQCPSVKAGDICWCGDISAICITPSNHLYWRDCDHWLRRIDPVNLVCHRTSLHIEFTNELVSDRQGRIYFFGTDAKFYRVTFEYDGDVERHIIDEILIPLGIKSCSNVWNDSDWNIYLLRDCLYVLRGDTFVEVEYSPPNTDTVIMTSSRLDQIDPIWMMIDYTFDEDKMTLDLIRYRSKYDQIKYDIGVNNGIVIHPIDHTIYGIKEDVDGYSRLHIYVYEVPSLLNQCLRTVRKHYSEHLNDVRRVLPQDISSLL